MKGFGKEWSTDLHHPGLKVNFLCKKENRKKEMRPGRRAMKRGLPPSRVLESWFAFRELRRH